MIRAAASTVRNALANASVACGLFAWLVLPGIPSHAASGLAGLEDLCRSAIERHEYDKALKSCKRFNFNASKLAPHSIEYIDSLVSLGDLQTAIENYVDADAYYAAALQMNTELSGEESAMSKELLTTLIETKLRRGKTQDALTLMERLLKLYERASAATDSHVAVARVRYADLLAQNHQFLEAQTSYLAAIERLRLGGKATVTEYAHAVRHLAEMHELRGQFQFAEADYRLLLDIVEQNALGESTDRIRASLSRLELLTSQFTP